MDINETGKEMLYRHPWELSRTGCVLDVVKKYLDVVHKNKEKCRYLNTGAGDLYFDKALLSRYRQDEVYAIDIGYKKKSKNSRIHMFRYLEEIEEKDFDYAVMMDSLEYMEDDAGYVRKMADKLKNGGYFFFTLPACPALFSEHDRIVKNLRRYSSESFSRVLEKNPALVKVEEFPFYSSLFMVRFIQKKLHLRIDPEQKVTTGWKFSEDSPVTMLVAGMLNMDFVLNRFLAKRGIVLPGLSLFVVCRKKTPQQATGHQACCAAELRGKTE